jgi:transposase
MRVVVIDIHRSFAQVAILEDGRFTKELRVDLAHDRIIRFAKTLTLEDDVVIETTGNSAALERLLRPHVKRVIVANPRLVRAIAYARVKTDKIDARVLAKLHASGFLPEIWIADDDTQRRRRQATERMGVLEQAVRTKGRIHAILHANLIPKYSGHLFGKAGKKWLGSLPLPEDERAILTRLVEELERITTQLAELDQVIARDSLEDPRAVRLMTIPGIGPIVASTVLASIGDIARFPTPEKLSSYFGLTPSASPATGQRAPWPNFQTGKRRGSENARRSRMVGENCSRSTARIFRTRAEGPRRTRRGRGYRQKTCRHDLARAYERHRLRLRTSRFHSNEDAQSRFKSWGTSGIRKSRTRSRLLDQRDSPARGRIR